MLDDTSVDAVALAVRRNCPLWTDDLGLQRLVVESGIQMSTVWTQAVLKSAQEAGKFSQGGLGRAQAAMVDRGYVFTRLSAEDILGILDAVNWRVEHGPGHALCRVVAESAFLNRSNLAVVATAMKTAWSRDRRERAKAFVLGAVEANPLTGKRLAARIYRFPQFRRNVRLRTDTMSEASGSTHPRHKVRIVPVMFDPLGDRAGKAVKRYLRSWRSRDGEFRPRRNR